MRVPTSVTPDVAQAFREVWASIDRFAGAKNIDLDGRRIINAGMAIDGFDYVTKRDLDVAVEGLSAGDGHRLSPPAGTPPTVLYGTHAERLALSIGLLKDGTICYETDRAAFYQVQDDGTGTMEWWLAMCRPLRTADAKPGDLGTTDAGFTWFDQVEGIYWRWSGGVWNYYIGSYVNTYANMPAAAEADRGFLFIASDYGEHVWRKGASAFELLEGVGGPMRSTAADRAMVAGELGANDAGFRFQTTDQGNHVWRWSGTAFVLIEGEGGPMRGTLSPDQKPTLTANDAGFVFYSTDFDRAYRWTGTAWADAPGQPERGAIQHFTDALLPGAWWALCNGSATTRSTATGGTAAFTTPDLTTANRFLRSVATTTGGTGGNAIAHTHVDPGISSPATTTVPSAEIEVQSGTGTIVATRDHKHTSNVQDDLHNTNGPSGVGGDDALPPYMNMRPYIRL